MYDRVRYGRCSIWGRIGGSPPGSALLWGLALHVPAMPDQDIPWPCISVSVLLLHRPDTGLPHTVDRIDSRSLGMRKASPSYVTGYGALDVHSSRNWTCRCGIETALFV